MGLGFRRSSRLVAKGDVKLCVHMYLMSRTLIELIG